MRKKIIQISIPEPCHEGWNKMTPNEKGRHCANCDKTVIDFSTKADWQIALAFRKGKNLCGRFTASQLNRNIVLESPLVRAMRWKAVGFVLGGLLTAVGGSAQTSWTGPVPTPIEQREGETNKEKETTARPTFSALLLADKDPIPHAPIEFQGKQYRSDEGGAFTLSVDLHQPLVIEIRLSGYVPMNLQLASTDLLQTKLLAINLEKTPNSSTPNINPFINLEVTANRKPSEKIYYLGGAIGGVINEYATIPKRVQKAPKTKTNWLENVYPNPFGNQLNIKLKSDKTETLQLMLTDSKGSKIQGKSVQVSQGKNQFQLDLTPENLAAGSYFLSILRKGKLLETKILKKAF